MPAPIDRVKWSNKSVFRLVKFRKKLPLPEYCLLLIGYCLFVIGYWLWAPREPLVTCVPKAKRAVWAQSLKIWPRAPRPVMPPPPLRRRIFRIPGAFGGGKGGGTRIALTRQGTLDAVDGSNRLRPVRRPQGTPDFYKRSFLCKNWIFDKIGFLTWFGLVLRLDSDWA